ncbi:MAG: dGTP triphosphohydrolase, partial [Asticcacaulis sp.]
MEWDRLLNVERLNDPNYVQQKYRPSYSQDIDRILFSRPFRRLANKTQVHPLYDNDHIHHRLIHSLEVATVGRTLGIEIGAWLCDEGRIEHAQVDIMAGLVQAACMAHDIGNPPFGHSGESAIAAWFGERFDRPTGLIGDIERADRAEFEAFEGNAQGFRILTRTEMYRNDGGMRLSYGALGAFAKYPVSAGVKPYIGSGGTVGGAPYIGLKKYGFFRNDTETFGRVADQLGLIATAIAGPAEQIAGHWWRRHPLAFLMEAADDICYNIMDLEDAYSAGDIEFATVANLLKPLMPGSNRAYPEQGDDDTVARFRALSIKGAIQA